MLGTISGNCRTEKPHTGVGNCPKQMGTPSFLLLSYSDADFPLDKTAFNEGIEDWVYDPGKMRLFPINTVVGATINGGDINAPQLGAYGGIRPIQLNPMNVAYQVDGGDCLFKELAKLNKQKMRVFIGDNEGYLYGTTLDRAGELRFAGFEGYLYATSVPSDGSNTYNLTINVYYTANYEREKINMSALELDNIPEGLIGAYLVDGVKVVTSCSAIDITGDYPWVTSDFVDKSGVNPTSVVYDGATNTLTLTPAGSYRLNDGDKLKTNGILGIDGEEKYVTV